MTATAWPAARLDPIRRARVLAAAIPSAGFSERIIDAPYDAVWPWLVDLERSVPSFDREVRAIRWTGPNRIVATTRYGVPWPFDVVIEDGWCLMQGAARGFLVVMAARPEDDRRTRYAQIEAVPLPGARVMRRFLQRSVESDGAGIERHVERMGGAGPD